jgi:hypothetical protein
MDGINAIDWIVFRPSKALRAVLGIFGVFCCAIAVNGWMSGRYSSVSSMAALTLLLLLPSLVGAAVVGRRVEANTDGLRSVSIFGALFVAWSGVNRIDQGRGSFVIETASGPVSAGWIAPGEREQLMRLVIERAKLTRVIEPSRYGLVAQYVPRAQDIGFVPHAKRREQKSG